MYHSPLTRRQAVSKAQRVLVTGSEGYIGSVLMPLLLRAGHDAVGMDIGWFVQGRLVEPEGTWQHLLKDVRDVEPSELEGYDAIVHLAALSNDPLGELDRELTLDINYRATVRLAEVARRAGVKRFIFSSSCSMYGRSNAQPAAGNTAQPAAGNTAQRAAATAVPLTESAAFAPQTVYAESKVLAERELGALAADGFSPVFLRNATAYGISPRQRFDLVVPNLAGFAHTTGEVRLMSDGSPWRPLVHIRDIGSAVLAALSAPVEAIHNQAFNIGVDADNYQIRDIAMAVQAAFPESRVTFGPTSNQPDTRSYRVNFAKAASNLPGFAPTWTLQRGIQECAVAFQRIGLDRATFEHKFYTRLRQVAYLLDEHLLDKRLRWTAASGIGSDLQELADVVAVSLSQEGVDVARHLGSELPAEPDADAAFAAQRRQAVREESGRVVSRDH